MRETQETLEAKLSKVSVLLEVKEAKVAGQMKRLTSGQAEENCEFLIQTLRTAQIARKLLPVSVRVRGKSNR